MGKIEQVQSILQEQKIDGWLLYDFRRNNDLAIEFVELPKELHLTRRFFYWIPAKGVPVKIVHQVESFVLDHLPGEQKIYFEWQVLHAHLKEVLKGSKRVAMEYSPKCSIPVVSKIDGGTLELVRDCKVEVVSSGSFLQAFTCAWSEAQFRSHLEAAKVLDETAQKTWNWIGQMLKGDKQITEYDAQQFILEEIHRNGCLMDGEPIVGVNANSANPHYAPEKGKSLSIKKGDFILIDLWCKKKEENAVYADITRVGMAGQPTSKQKEIFQIVRKAQKAATEFIKKRVEKKEVVKGCEADEVCRKVIADAGYGKFFTHRTGHNIHKEAHGPGANIDSIETFDDRPLISRTCFSIEPGIYLPGEFGVRLEYDIYIHQEGRIQVTGGVQEEIVTL